MSAELVNRLAAPAPRNRTPDLSFAARPRLVNLRDELTRAARQLRSSHWGEPAVFFFDPERQTELESARPAEDRFATLASVIADEMPLLLEAVEVRHAARAVDGLKAAAGAMAPHCPEAKDLADLLAVPDDEVFLVLSPAARTGVRLHLRGASGVAQLRALLAQILKATDFQLFTPAAIRPDGTLPSGFAGCEHWLWPTQLLSGIPRLNGERVVLVGPAVVRTPGEAEPRFPTLQVECERIEMLTPFRVAAELSRLCGHPVPVAAGERPAIARAA